MLIESRHIDTMPPPPTMFDGIEGVSCSRCGDLGLRWNPRGFVEPCPVIQLGLAHDEPNAAAKIVERSTRSMVHRKLPVNSLAFDVARALVFATTDSPASRQTLLDRYFGWASNQRLRKFHALIEELRAVWLLPVASRKQQPHGYWIATDEADFAEWVNRSKSSPIRQLTTIHRVAKANFPLLAEQLEFEFWKDEALPPDA